MVVMLGSFVSPEYNDNLPRNYDVTLLIANYYTSGETFAMPSQTINHIRAPK